MSMFINPAGDADVPSENDDFLTQVSNALGALPDNVARLLSIINGLQGEIRSLVEQTRTGGASGAQAIFPSEDLVNVVSELRVISSNIKSVNKEGMGTVLRNISDRFEQVISDVLGRVGFVPDYTLPTPNANYDDEEEVFTYNKFSSNVYDSETSISRLSATLFDLRLALQGIKSGAVTPQNISPEFLTIIETFKRDYSSSVPDIYSRMSIARESGDIDQFRVLRERFNLARQIFREASAISEEYSREAAERLVLAKSQEQSDKSRRISGVDIDQSAIFAQAIKEAAFLESRGISGSSNIDLNQVNEIINQLNERIARISEEGQGSVESSRNVASLRVVLQSALKLKDVLDDAEKRKIDILGSQGTPDLGSIELYPDVFAEQMDKVARMVKENPSFDFDTEGIERALEGLTETDSNKKAFDRIKERIEEIKRIREENALDLVNVTDSRLEVFKKNARTYTDKIRQQVALLIAREEEDPKSETTSQLEEMSASLEELIKESEAAEDDEKKQISLISLKRLIDRARERRKKRDEVNKREEFAKFLDSDALKLIFVSESDANSVVSLALAEEDGIAVLRDKIAEYLRLQKIGNITIGVEGIKSIEAMIAEINAAVQRQGVPNEDNAELYEFLNFLKSQLTASRKEVAGRQSEIFYGLSKDDFLKSYLSEESVNTYRDFSTEERSAGLLDALKRLSERAKIESRGAKSSVFDAQEIETLIQKINRELGEAADESPTQKNLFNIYNYLQKLLAQVSKEERKEREDYIDFFGASNGVTHFNDYVDEFPETVLKRLREYYEASETQSDLIKPDFYHINEMLQALEGSISKNPSKKTAYEKVRAFLMEELSKTNEFDFSNFDFSDINQFEFFKGQAYLYPDLVLKKLKELENSPTGFMHNVESITTLVDEIQEALKAAEEDMVAAKLDPIKKLLLKRLSDITTFADFSPVAIVQSLLTADDEDEKDAALSILSREIKKATEMERMFPYSSGFYVERTSSSDRKDFDLNELGKSIRIRREEIESIPDIKERIKKIKELEPLEKSYEDLFKTVNKNYEDEIIKYVFTPQWITYASTSVPGSSLGTETARMVSEFLDPSSEAVRTRVVKAKVDEILEKESFYPGSTGFTREMVSAIPESIIEARRKLFDPSAKLNISDERRIELAKEYDLILKRSESLRDYFADREIQLSGSDAIDVFENNIGSSPDILSKRLREAASLERRVPLSSELKFDDIKKLGQTIEKRRKAIIDTSSGLTPQQQAVELEKLDPLQRAYEDIYKIYDQREDEKVSLIDIAKKSATGYFPGAEISKIFRENIREKPELLTKRIDDILRQERILPESTGFNLELTEVIEKTIERRKKAILNDPKMTDAEKADELERVERLEGRSEALVRYFAEQKIQLSGLNGPDAIDVFEKNIGSSPDILSKRLREAASLERRVPLSSKLKFDDIKKFGQTIEERRKAIIDTSSGLTPQQQAVELEKLDPLQRAYDDIYKLYDQREDEKITLDLPTITAGLYSPTGGTPHPLSVEYAVRQVISDNIEKSPDVLTKRIEDIMSQEKIRPGSTGFTSDLATAVQEEVKSRKEIILNSTTLTDKEKAEELEKVERLERRSKALTSEFLDISNDPISVMTKQLDLGNADILSEKVRELTREYEELGPGVGINFGRDQIKEARKAIMDKRTSILADGSLTKEQKMEELAKLNSLSGSLARYSLTEAEATTGSLVDPTLTQSAFVSMFDKAKLKDDPEYMKVLGGRVREAAQAVRKAGDEGDTATVNRLKGIFDEKTTKAISDDLKDKVKDLKATQAGLTDTKEKEALQLEIDGAESLISALENLSSSVKASAENNQNNVLKLIGQVVSALALGQFATNLLVRDPYQYGTLPALDVMGSTGMMGGVLSEAFGAQEAVQQDYKTQGISALSSVGSLGGAAAGSALSTRLGKNPLTGSLIGGGIGYGVSLATGILFQDTIGDILSGTLDAQAFRTTIGKRMIDAQSYTEDFFNPTLQARFAYGLTDDNIVDTLSNYAGAGAKALGYNSVVVGQLLGQYQSSLSSVARGSLAPEGLVSVTAGLETYGMGKEGAVELLSTLSRSGLNDIPSSLLTMIQAVSGPGQNDNYTMNVLLPALSKVIESRAIQNIARSSEIVAQETSAIVQIFSSGEGNLAKMIKANPSEMYQRIMGVSDQISSNALQNPAMLNFYQSRGFSTVDIIESDPRVLLESLNVISQTQGLTPESDKNELYQAAMVFAKFTNLPESNQDLQLYKELLRTFVTEGADSEAFQNAQRNYQVSAGKDPLTELLNTLDGRMDALIASLGGQATTNMVEQANTFYKNMQLSSGMMLLMQNAVMTMMQDAGFVVDAANQAGLEFLDELIKMLPDGALKDALTAQRAAAAASRPNITANIPSNIPVATAGFGFGLSVLRELLFGPSLDVAEEVMAGLRNSPAAQVAAGRNSIVVTEDYLKDIAVPGVMEGLYMGISGSLAQVLTEFTDPNALLSTALNLDADEGKEAMVFLSALAFTQATNRFSANAEGLPTEFRNFYDEMIQSDIDMSETGRNILLDAIRADYGEGAIDFQDIQNHPYSNFYANQDDYLSQLNEFVSFLESGQLPDNLNNQDMFNLFSLMGQPNSEFFESFIKFLELEFLRKIIPGYTGSLETPSEQEIAAYDVENVGTSLLSSKSNTTYARIRPYEADSQILREPSDIYQEIVSNFESAQTEPFELAKTQPTTSGKFVFIMDIDAFNPDTIQQELSTAVKNYFDANVPQATSKFITDMRLDS